MKFQEQNQHLINENVKLKLVLIDIIERFGDRGAYNGGLFARDHQPEPIQKAMDVVSWGTTGVKASA